MGDELANDRRTRDGMADGGMRGDELIGDGLIGDGDQPGTSMDSTRGDAIVQDMIANDSFSRWMNLNVESVGQGAATLTCVIREEMSNGFGVLHGGVLFSLADSALAFAAASTGRKALTTESSITFLKPCYAGDKLTAVTETIRAGNRVGHYLVHISNQDGHPVALFKGSVLFQTT